MSDLAELNLSIKTSQVKTGIKDLDGLTDAAKKAERSSDKLTQASERQRGVMSNLQSQYGNVISILARLAAAYGVVRLVTESIKTSANFEQTRIAFETLLGSAAKASQFVRDLQKMGAETPFEFKGLADASRSLLALGFDAQKIMPMLGILGDTAAAFGENELFIIRIGTALGQMQAKGKVSGEEMRQLAEAGIPAWRMLADAIGTDVKGAMEMVEKGSIDSAQAINALLLGMQTKYAGAMEKQSRTLLGLYSTFQDSVTTMMAGIGDSLAEGLDLRSKMKGAIDFLTDFGKVIVDVVRYMNGLPPQFMGTEAATARWVSVLKVLAIVIGVILAYKIIGFIYGFGVAMVTAVEAAVALAGGLGILLAIIAALVVAVGAFEIGTWLYDEFRVVQDGSASIIRAMSDLWTYIKFIWNVGVQSVISLFKSMWQNIKSLTADGLSVLSTAFRYMAKVPGPAQNAFKTLQSGLAATVKEMRASADEAASISNTALSAFSKSLNFEIKSSKIADSYKVELSGIRSQIESTSEFTQESLNEMVTKTRDILSRLSADDDPKTLQHSIQTASVLRQSLVDTLEAADAAGKNIGTGARVQIAGLSKDLELALNKLVALQVHADIANDFQGKARKGNSLADKMKGDLQKALDSTKSVLDQVGKNFEGLFKIGLPGDQVRRSLKEINLLLDQSPPLELKAKLLVEKAQVEKDIATVSTMIDDIAKGIPSVDDLQKKLAASADEARLLGEAFGGVRVEYLIDQFKKGSITADQMVASLKILKDDLAGLDKVKANPFALDLTKLSRSDNKDDPEVRGIQKKIDDLRRERDILRSFGSDSFSKDLVEREKQLSDFQVAVEKAFPKNLEEQKRAVREYAEAYDGLQKTKAQISIHDTFIAFETERSAIFRTNEEQERYIALTKIRADATRAYGDDQAKVNEVVDQANKRLQENQNLRQLATAARQIGDAFSASFTDIVFGAKDASQAIQDLTLEIEKMIFQQAVAAPLSEVITKGALGFASRFATSFLGAPAPEVAPTTVNALGNAFDRGSVIPFAAGGIVDSPTMFDMSRNRTGLMGEAGPEGIVPLKRMADGRLGVGNAGSGSGVTNVNITVNTPDAGSFRKNTSQIAGEIKRAIGQR